MKKFKKIKKYTVNTVDMNEKGKFYTVFNSLVEARKFGTQQRRLNNFVSLNNFKNILLPLQVFTLIIMILNNKISDKQKIKETRKKEVDKKLILQGSLKPHRGHTLFKLDLSTYEISKAKFETQDVHYTDVVAKKRKKNKKIIKEEGCIYISALNINNLKKVIKRDYGFIL